MMIKQPLVAVCRNRTDSLDLQRFSRPTRPRFLPEFARGTSTRLTFGPAALTACRCIVMVVAGAEKRAMLARAMAPDADPRALPVTWILRLPQTEILLPLADERP